MTDGKMKTGLDVTNGRNQIAKKDVSVYLVHESWPKFISIRVELSVKFINVQNSMK